MKVHKQITIFLIFMLSMLMLNQSAVAETIHSEKWINPIWRHFPPDHPFPVPEIGKTPRTSILCTSYEAFKDAVQQQCENRTESFAINLVYDFDLNEVKSIIIQAFDDIIDEDPYTGGNIYSRQYIWGGISGNADITFLVAYCTTYEQEQMVTTRVEEIIPQIIVQGMNEEEKVKAIHDWVVLNVEYDQTYQKHSAYDALYEEKETVCQGYTLLVIRMLREVNINSKFVFGQTSGGSHSWNLVYVCGNWYQLDATFDDPITNPADPDFIRWDYYLISDSQMSADRTWETSDYPAAPAAFQEGDCDPVIAEVTTAAVSEVTQTTARSGGNVTSDGGDFVTSRGVCWSASPNPSVADNTLSEGSGTGLFSVTLTGLDANTIYYLRAYATNSIGVSYGNEVSFTTLSHSLDQVIAVLQIMAGIDVSGSTSLPDDINGDDRIGIEEAVYILMRLSENTKG